MDKYATHILAVALLLHLVCYATIVQCRTIANMENEKVNIPYGLCGREKWCTGTCFCCFLTPYCYSSQDECKQNCKNSGSSENTLAARKPLLYLILRQH
ncbi:hypothetical protein CFC21_078046, partial [Triticum aestivum]